MRAIHRQCTPPYDRGMPKQPPPKPVRALATQSPTGPNPNRLGQVRVRAGLSQAKLIEAAGVSESYLKQLESGRRALTADAFIALCPALNCTPEDIAPADPDPKLREQMLLARFRLMQPADRELFVATARRLANL